MTTAQKIYEMLSKMPEERVIQVLNFVTELDKSQLDAQQRLDFRKAAGLGAEIWRSVDVEEYLHQERSSWD